MRALDYALRQALVSLWRRREASLFAVLAIALAVVVLGSLLLLTWNAEQVVAGWAASSEFSVYLRDDASSEQRGAIESRVEASGAADGHDYVSKAQAQARFRREFAELASLASALPDNPFPASIEVRVRDAAAADGRAEALIRQVAAMPGVADVRYDREWLAQALTALRTLRVSGGVLAGVMALAAAITVASVVRLGLFARRDEIEIMELVGAPLAFIRGPFVVEGLLQGGLGAALAALVLGLAVVAARQWWSEPLAAVLGGPVLFLPAVTSTLLVAGGMAVGALGGLAASRHAGRPFGTAPRTVHVRAAGR